MRILTWPTGTDDGSYALRLIGSIGPVMLAIGRYRQTAVQGQRTSLLQDGRIRCVRDTDVREFVCVCIPVRIARTVDCRGDAQVNVICVGMIWRLLNG